MIDRESKLSIVRQCQLLRLHRSGVYYLPHSETEKDLDLMRRIDEIHLAHPFMGSRQIRDALQREGRPVNRKRITRLMKLMGLSAIAPGPHTSRPHPQHTKYPYLLKGLKVERINQVWSTDITYVPMKRGFMYLVAIMDWHSRRVLSWQISNTLDPHFCVAALHEALAKYGTPDIFNTDQGAQFTSDAFLDVLKARGIKISMDGKGRALDNVFVERLWRSVKYECIYLHAFEDGDQLKTGLKKYFAWYNRERPHSKLNRQTPDEVYFALNEQRTAA